MPPRLRRKGSSPAPMHRRSLLPLRRRALRFSAGVALLSCSLSANRPAAGATAPDPQNAPAAEPSAPASAPASAPSSNPSLPPVTTDGSTASTPTASAPGSLHLVLGVGLAGTAAMYRYEANETYALEANNLAVGRIGPKWTLLQRPLVLAGINVHASLAYPFSRRLTFLVTGTVGFDTVVTSGADMPIGRFTWALRGNVTGNLDYLLWPDDRWHLTGGFGWSILALQRADVPSNAPVTLSGPQGFLAGIGVSYDLAGLPLSIGARLDAAYLRDNFLDKTYPAELQGPAQAASTATATYRVAHTFAGNQEIVPLTLTVAVKMRLFD